MLKILKPDFQFEDDRGSLTQLVHSGYEQVNVLKSKKGVLRGGHYHKISREVFFVVSGSVKLELSENGQIEKHVFATGDFFQIEPYVIHSMFFPEDCVMIALYDKCVEQPNGEKDIFVK